MNKYPVPILPLILCGIFVPLLITGCFFKSDKTGTADDIVCEMLYSDNAGEVLIAHEKVFHATNKSSGGGITTTSGYANARLSAYDVKTGKLLARHVLGGEKGQPSIVLTIHRDQLWVLSKDDKQVQLQTYDPRTLELRSGTDMLLQQAAFLKGHLANPEWYALPRYFGYDATRGIILSDDQGFRFALDPATLKTTKITDANYQLPTFLNDPKAERNTAIYDEGIVLNMSGSPRRVIEYQFKPVPDDPGYLEGSFLVDNNIARVMQLQAKPLAKIRAKIAEKESTRDSLQALMDKLPTDSRGHKDYETKIRLAGYRIDEAYRAAGGISPYHRPGKADWLLQSSPGRFFVVQSSSTGNDAMLVLSHLEWKPGQPMQQRWQAPVNGMFFNPENARETSNFKYVFSSGNPQFRFKWADVTKGGQQLLLTWMLHTSCIDVNTGKVLWQIRH